MIDLTGTELSKTEEQLFADDRIGGLILFSRNFESSQQIKQLIQAVRASSKTPVLIAVDHEGGRVQRFRKGFSAIPPMRRLGDLYSQSPPLAEDAAYNLGGLLAAELSALDMDFSFTPVVDLDMGNSSVIGDRSFHTDAVIVSKLANSLMQGLHQAGMAAVAKHFPGHGYVSADSHLELPVDDRQLSQIREKDLIPFKALVDAGVEGVMPAHIVYKNIDSHAAGFSRFWIQTVLRKEIGFKGAIFSDDLSMQGAAETGSPVQRAEAALAAGCDMLLVCNDPPAVIEILNGLQLAADRKRSNRLNRLQRRDNTDMLKFRQQVAGRAREVLSKLA